VDLDQGMIELKKYQAEKKIRLEELKEQKKLSKKKGKV
jgi:hypothetical protein